MKHSIEFETCLDAGDDILVSAIVDDACGELEIESLTATLDGKEVELTLEETSRIEESIWSSFWEDVSNPEPVHSWEVE